MTVIEPPPCPGCGLVAGPADGPTHPYIGASPGCWALFGELTVTGLAGVPSGFLVVDTYAVQHPGAAERRALQSVAVHLITLCALLERDLPPDRAIALRRQVVDAPLEPWPHLPVPWPVGTSTVADVLAAPLPERDRQVRSWVDGVWAAYADHQARVRGWVDQALR